MGCAYSKPPSSDVSTNHGAPPGRPSAKQAQRPQPPRPEVLAALLAKDPSDRAANATALRGVDAGVRVGWLKALARECGDMTTTDVVETLVKPATAERQCRYVALLAAENVGRATAFCSHTWRASFRDLVAAICHVFDDSTFVWVSSIAPPSPPPPLSHILSTPRSSCVRVRVCVCVALCL